MHKIQATRDYNIYSMINTNQKKNNTSNPFEELIGLDAKIRLSLLKLVQTGFDYKTIGYAQQRIGLTQAQVGELINVNVRTLTRRKNEGYLNTPESEQLYRVVMLVEQAIDLMQDRAAALHWLKTPKRELEGKTPLELANTQSGIDAIKKLLDRVEDLSKIYTKGDLN